MTSDPLRRMAITSALVVMLVLVSCQNPSGSRPSTVSQVPRITPQRLKEMLDASEGVVVVDTRIRESYEHSHIPDALSIPLSETEELHGELSKGMKIVFYCT